MGRDRAGATSVHKPVPSAPNTCAVPPPPHTHLCNGVVLVDRRLHESLLERRDAVLQVLHLGPDTGQLLVGAVQTLVGLAQCGALGGDDLWG